MTRFCMDCGRALSDDEIGLTMKLVHRDSRVFFCMTCLAVRLRTTVDYLQAAADDFRRQGCTLFTHK